MKLITKFFALSLMLSVASVAGANQRLGVAWIGKSGMANNVFAGVQERLSEIAPDIQFDIRTELADSAALAGVIGEFEADGFDGMVVMRSNGAVYLAENPPALPTFIGGANHPVQLGVVTDMAAPGGNVTGVTYHIDPALSLDSFGLLAPGATSYLLVTQTDYPSSAIDGETTMLACAEMGLTCHQVYAVGAEEVASVVAEHIAEYDAVILGNQANVYPHAAVALEAANGKPVFSYAKSGVYAGALGGLIADDHTLGRMLADQIYSVLYNGGAAADVPIGTDTEPTLYLNLTTADRLGADAVFEHANDAVIVE